MNQANTPALSARYRAVFRCIRGCSGDHPLDEVIYECPKCGDLLEVVHDLEPLRRLSGGEWKQILDARSVCRTGLHASGVWSRKEFVCPEIPDTDIVTTGEGNTSLFRADRLGAGMGLEQLWIKQCGNSLTGSFKDLGMTVLVSMVHHMRNRGKEIPAVVCASTGDTSASLAAYCAAAGIPAVVFLPQDKISTAQLMQPLAHGAVTIAIDSDFDGCMRVVREITSRHNIYLANSMNSLRIEGQKTISIELCQQLDWQAPDWVVIPGGNLGNVSALGQGFLLMRALGMIDRLPRIACAQAENANPLYRAFLTGFESCNPIRARSTAASAIQIGNPVSIRKAVRVLRELDGVVEQASEEELAEAAGEAGRSGFHACPHTGVALAALKKLARRGVIRKEQRVAVISTAHGLKFTAFRPFANSPIEVEADYQKVCDALYRALAARR